MKSKPLNKRESHVNEKWLPEHGILSPQSAHTIYARICWEIESQYRFFIRRFWLRWGWIKLDSQRAYFTYDAFNIFHHKNSNYQMDSRLLQYRFWTELHASYKACGVNQINTDLPIRMFDAFKMKLISSSKLWSL